MNDTLEINNLIEGLSGAESLQSESSKSKKLDISELIKLEECPDGSFIVWFTDIHLMQNSKHNFIVIKKLIQIIKKLNPKYVVNTGDTLHTKNIIHGDLLNLYAFFVKSVCKYTTLITAIGNHDWCVEHEKHPFVGLEDIKNHIVVDSFYKINDDIGVMAYCRTKDRFLEMMEGLKGCKYVFGHFALEDFDLGSGYEEKDSWCQMSLFEGIKAVYSGHWHLAQEREVRGTKFVYAGSTATVDQGESDQIKRVCFFDEDMNMSSVDTELTLHKTLRMNVDDEFPSIPEEDIKRGIEYRLIVKGTPDQLSRFKLPRNYPAKLVRDYVGDVSKRMKLSVVESRESSMKKYVNDVMSKEYGPDQSKWPASLDAILNEGMKLSGQILNETQVTQIS